MTSVLEMDSTDLLRSEGALVKLNLGRRRGCLLAGNCIRLPSAFPPKLLIKPVCAANTYESAAHRPNLVVLTEAQAIKIELDHSAQDVKAGGVSFHFKCRSFTAKARKEVVLSAGQLIMTYDTK
ncbi:GMC oxidoreductase domain-containing protein [Rhizoctonia solani AG-1 IA]|uniref:GMC oxidoreductase domain-containing protein n=1 Tax=Thanatephorus cucumeris (strain AG1-IA) TaxID=983506 RepID=L8X152_THACA|nr:GMC oxidoreductase domain-containing protein [Rhizoctonia solani AG-1 IA]